MEYKACEKPKVNYRKMLWSPDEDQRLRHYILKHGHGCWSTVPAKAGLLRSGKSCRLRWINYLRPGLKRSAFCPEEEAIVMKLHAILGNKWSQIAMHLPGRTDNEVKNHWNTNLKKKVIKVDGSTSHASTNKSLNSDNQVQKLEQYLDENNSQTSLSESSDSLESFSASLCQSTRHVTNKIPSQGASQPYLPKVLFADWLPMFSEDVQISPSLDGGMNCQQQSIFNSEVLSPELLQFDMKSTDDFLHGFDDTSIYGEFEFQPQFVPVEQVPEVNFDHLLSFDETYRGFELNHDVFIDL